MRTFGYCRVSSVEQNTDRQMLAMRELQIPPEQIYVEKVSGKDFNRPEYTALMEILRHGDLLYVKSIDRLGRDYEEIQNQWRIITKERGVDIAVIDMPLLDTRREKNLVGTFLSDVVLQILSFVAQNERENIRERQFEGIKAAKERGIRFGRPSKNPPDNFAKIVRQWEVGSISFEKALELTGLKQATFYNRLRELRARSGG